MTTPFWCVLAVLLLPLFLAFAGGYFRGKAFGAADNRNPRAQAAKLEGPGARAYAAQANAWEAAILFSATILTTHAAGLSAEAATPWALAFVAFRILHGIFYIQDLDKARSLSFIGGMVCIVTLFVKAA
ncbi:MAPEG family protein [Myxococcota bacterium]|nr:MAPEG family protein [Myxococcota bacterium]